MDLNDLQKFGKKIIDHPAIRNQTDDVQLIMQIIAYDQLGVMEFAQDFDFKHDLWYMYNFDKLTEENFNASIKWFNDEYDDILEYLQRYKFDEIKPMLEAVTQLQEESGMHAEVYGQSFSKWLKELTKQIKGLL